MDKNISNIYNFFSHNMRTFNAEIVTTIECLKVGFIDSESEEFEIVYEASYLLDLYDIGLSIVLDYFSNELKNFDIEKVSVEEITEEFLKSVSGYVSSSEIEITAHYNNSTIDTNLFVFKNIYRIILYEIIKITAGSLNIKVDEKIEIEVDNLIEDFPDIFQDFKEILKFIGIDFNINNNKIILEKNS